MARGKSQRRVATVLFVDVVESTRVASEVGDRRWRELVGSFRGIVRRQLRRFDGHEVDTAGDGFFAWFNSPANGLQAAAAITADVQALGLDVRSGLHTGELEQIDGRLGGIAAHIGARVMALADAAEVLATTTVRDLVVGGDVVFEPLGEVDLKGVPGRWLLLRVSALAGQPLVNALASADAAQRRSGSSPTVGARRPLLWLVVGALGLALLIGGAWAAGLFGATPSASPSPSPTSLADPTATPTQIPSASPSPKPLPTFPVAVVRIDPFTNLVAEPVRDGHSHAGLNFVLLDNGNFWTDYGGIELVRRDIETGDFIDTIALWPEQVAGVQAGFGHLWVLHGHDPTLIERIDPLSGRTVTIDTKADVFDMAVGDVAVYILQNQGQLAEVNPSTNRLGEPYSTDTETDPVYMGFQNGRLALFEEAERRVAIFDPQTRTVIDTWDWSRFGLSSGSRDPSTGIVWVLDRTNQTVTPFDPTTHTFGPSQGVLGVPHQAAFGFGSVWVAAGTYIYRFAPTDHSVQKIIGPLEGVYAGSIGIDLPSESVWVSSCYGVACDDR